MPVAPFVPEGSWGVTGARPIMQQQPQSGDVVIAFAVVLLALAIGMAAI